MGGPTFCLGLGTPMARRRLGGRLRDGLGLVGLLVMIGWVGLLVRNQLVNLPRAAEMQARLEQEFELIAPPPGARLEGHSASHTASHALVGSTYAEARTYRELREHYDRELAEHGWRFHREKRMTDWGRNFGGKLALYCKGDYAAALHFAGERANYGWTYTVDLSWGLENCR